MSKELDERQGWIASLRPQTIIDRKRLELQRAAIEGEIARLEAAAKARTADDALRRIRAPTEPAVRVARRKCEAARRQLGRFMRRNELDRSVRNLFMQEEDDLRDAAGKACDEHRRLADWRSGALREAERMRADLIAARAALGEAGVDAQDAVSRVSTDLTRTMRSVLLAAAILLLGIIATPFLIRLVFYFILAPLAERRPTVRPQPPAGGLAPPSVLPQPSATSASIKLGAGEELLVRQGFLQSTSTAGAKATRGLLDWRHPLSSLASGLAFLTRVEGEGESTTVSAVHDPFAEVAVLDLPAGAACVLQPRALVAVVHPQGNPVRITSHWRLASLHAWLTLQLRYLMFHGPARLVIKGGRGFGSSVWRRGECSARTSWSGSARTWRTRSPARRPSGPTF